MLVIIGLLYDAKVHFFTAYLVLANMLKSICFLGRYGNHRSSWSLPRLDQKAFRTPKVELTSTPQRGLHRDSTAAVRRCA